MNDVQLSPDGRRDRRRLLALLGLGGAGALAAVLSRDSARATHGPDDGVNALHVGEENPAPADSGTSLLGSVQGDGDSVLNVQNQGGGQGSVAIAGGSDAVGAAGIVGSAPDGVGVVGFSQTGDGISGNSESGVGVGGSSGNGPGVRGFSFGADGVVGECENPDAAGVLGQAHVCLERGPCPGLAEGTGVRGISEAGIGVHGMSQAGPGVKAESESGNAFEGFSESGAGAFVSSLSGLGVDAVSETAAGVLGQCPNGVAGVLGIGSVARGEGMPPESARGVMGIAPGAAPAVQCVSGQLTDFPDPFVTEPDGGLALDVVGKARFSTAGAGAVPAGENATFVANAAVTAASHVSVTLTSDPSGRQLAWVDRSPGLGFTIHLTAGGAMPETSFTFLIVEPADGGGNGGPGMVFGDMDCDGDVDGTDALQVLAYAGGVPLPAAPGCPPVGAVL